jgi:hypothetical protein
MPKFLQLIGGLPVMTEVVVVGNTPLETVLDIIAGTPGNGNELQGPITAGVAMTIPDSITYSDIDLQVFLNGQQADPVKDFNYEGAGSRTQISFTFQLEVGDELTFRVDN